MSRRLPPLNALKAFEAAARTGSFTAAAAELGVSQAAVSQLVKGLEARLGVALFERRGNILSLTQRGAAYGPVLTDSFDRIALATEKLATQPEGVLTLACGPTVAIRWLIPRLPEFHRQHPSYEVRLSTSVMVEEAGPVSLLAEGITAAIRLTDQTGLRPDGLMAEPLFTADLFPVASPSVAARLRRPTDLTGETLLHVRHAEDEWPIWLRAAGLAPKMGTAGALWFDFHAFALQAALDGLGIALARRPFVEQDLAAGRLVAPFDLSVPKGAAWCLIYRPDSEMIPAFEAFRAWLR
ncbi:MAG: LysR substrate-binding domain-containing protein [Elstera sp.]|jgi:LysR family glycine cleavage system transcriptional activator